MSVVIETKDLPSEGLSTAVASSGFGTKRNCRGAHGISGAEGRPAAPSARRRQPPLAPERSCADLTVDIRARDEIRFQARVPAPSSRKCRRRA